MRLYSGDLSPYSARVRMQIYAKGIEGIEIGLPPDFSPQAFLKLSPLGRAPLLELADGDAVPESEVISEYLEALYPTPSLLGATPRETAHIRTVARIADVYLLNNMVMCMPQANPAIRNDGVRDLLTGQVKRGLRALEHYIGEDGFAVSGRLTMADCVLVPALFLIENFMPTVDAPNPIPQCPKVDAYWIAIQSNAHAARTLVELHRGLVERMELIKAMLAKAGSEA
jgi:glutathione S-transferase